MALFVREHASGWKAIAAGDNSGDAAVLSVAARSLLESLRARGASFGHELARSCGIGDGELRQALGELVAAGQIASDGFAGLRGLIADREKGSRKTRPRGDGPR